MPQLIDRG